MLILLAGCSGSGKNTIIKELLKRNSNLKFLKSCTTRKKRFNENDEYVFLSKEEFDKKLKNDEMFEHEEIHQNFYGLTKKVLEEIATSNENNQHYIKDIGVLGHINLLRFFKGKVPVLSIFLTAPKKELIRRLKERGEKEIDLRLSRMEFEMGYVRNFDVVINNVHLEKTVARIEKLINKYSAKPLKKS